MDLCVQGGQKNLWEVLKKGFFVDYGVLGNTIVLCGLRKCVLCIGSFENSIHFIGEGGLENAILLYIKVSKM